MRRFAFALLSLGLLAGVARGGDLLVSEQPFSVNVQREPLNMREPVFRAFISVADNKSTFIIPEKFGASGDPAHGHLMLKTFEGDSFITLDFVASETGLTAENCKDHLLGRYANSRVVGEFARPVGGQSAKVFDVQWKSENGFAMATRAAFFRTASGNVELTITTNSKKFGNAKTTLNEVMGTFANSINGNLVVVRLAASN